MGFISQLVSWATPIGKAFTLLVIAVTASVLFGPEKLKQSGCAKVSLSTMADWEKVRHFLLVFVLGCSVFFSFFLLHCGPVWWDSHYITHH